jgi:hypothetical protein
MAYPQNPHEHTDASGPLSAHGTALSPPKDERHSFAVEVRHRADQIVRTAARAGVIVPIVLGVGGGLVALNLGVDGPAITDGLIVGGILSGLFNYGQAIAEVTKGRRQLQIQLAAGESLKTADLARIDLSRSYFRGKNLEAARLSGATCYESDFSFANLRDARLTRGSFTRATFDHADMTAAGCFEAKMTRCSLVQTDLEGASMCGADLRHTDLSGANLRSADLRRARLDSSILDEADLNEAWYSDSTSWPSGFEPPSDRTADPYGRVFRDDESQNEVQVVTMDLTSA